ncbi:TPA: bacterial Ig-like domain-containing protein [Enterococcus faecalis]
MRKKFILLLFVLIFSIKQEEVVFSEMETVSTKAEIIEPYDKGLKSMELLNPYYIEKGGFLDPRKVVFKATDENDKDIPLSEIRYNWLDNALDTSQEGNSAYAKFFWMKDKNQTFYVSNIIVAYDLVLETKNSTLYQGEIWNPQDNFVKAYDEDAKPVYWSDDRINTNDASIDSNRPGVYHQTYTLKGQNKEVSSSFTVTVKEDQTKVKLKDTELHVGQKWDLGSVFKNVVDKDGNPIKPEKVNYVWIDGNKTREIDTSKPGKHTVKIAVENAKGDLVYSNEVTVTVKEDKTKAELKDTELYVGQKWGLGSVFKYAIDKDGNPIKLEQVPWVNIDGKWVNIDGKPKELIDTNKPGTHTVLIAIRNAADVDYAYEWAHSNVVTVTVKEEPFTIKQVPYFDFEDHILVSTNKSVVNKKENPTIDLETPSIMGKDWQLQVELSPFLDKKNSKSILKGVSLYIPKGKLESDLETEEPTQYDCQLEANGKASILMHGTKTKGKGRWKNKLATKGITLSIPPENKKGNYESTLHWTLLDVPGQSVNGDLV